MKKSIKKKKPKESIKHPEKPVFVEFREMISKGRWGKEYLNLNKRGIPSAVSDSDLNLALKFGIYDQLRKLNQNILDLERRLARLSAIK